MKSERGVGARRVPWALGALVMAVVLAALPIHAFIPKADRTMKAIAQVNRSSGRSQALQLELTMRIGERDAVARGQLISHPSGLARLELRGFSGRVDRYLLSGSELIAAKDGRRLDLPEPLLQPYFFLQPSTATTLRAALDAFGVASDSIGLAHCGEADCFVIGDPRLAAPLPQVLPDAYADGGTEPGSVLLDPLEVGADEADPTYALAAELTNGDDGSGGLVELTESDLGGSLEGPELVIADDAVLPRLWVDTEDLQVRRIDRASGVYTEFGPIVSFEKLMVPAWFEIHQPGAAPIRFDVDRAVQVNAPPQAFSRKWVFAPVERRLPGSGPESDGSPSGSDPSAAAETPGQPARGPAAPALP